MSESSTARATRGRLAGDAGTTLVEVLMSVIIVGIAGAAILGGLASSIWGTDTHHKQVQVGLALTSAAERLKDPALAPVPCATPSTPSYIAAVRAGDRPAGWPADTTVRITAVRYSDGAGFTGGCNDTDALGHRLTTQLITLQATSPDGRARASVAVAKGVTP